MKTKKIAVLLLAVLMLFSFTSCKPLKLKKKLDPLDMVLSTVRYDDGMKASFLKHKDRFTDVHAASYGMNKEQANDFLKNADRYGVYSIDTRIQNREENSYTFLKIQVEGEHDGIWLNDRSINGEISVPAGSISTDFMLSFIADNQKLDIPAIYETLSDLKISVVYYVTPADDETTVKESEYKTLSAKNYIALSDDTDQLKEVKATFGSVEDGGDYEELFKNDKATLTGYGFADAVTERYLAKNTKWECYVLAVNVDNNNNTENLTVYGTTVQANGQKGVWVSEKSMDGDEIGIPGGNESTVYFLLLVDPDVPGGVTVAETVKSMKISLRCSMDRTDIEQPDTCLSVPGTIEVKAK